MASIASCCARIKTDLEQVLGAQWIQDACQSLGYHWRQRTLGPAQTVHLALLQLLQANISLGGLRRLSGGEVSAWALCKAKARLPLGLLRELGNRLCQRVGTLGQ